jgi:hypothetical protein
MNDTEGRFAERLAVDLAHLLGIGVAIENISAEEHEGGMRVVASILFDGRIETVEAWAPDESMLYRLLMSRAVDLWRVSAFSGLAGPL